MMISASTSGEGPITARELKERQFAPVKFIVEGLIPTGLTILAGAPKAKKSWLALDIASSVSRGVSCLDDQRNHCPKGAVLYLALEDSQARIRSRLGHLLGDDVDWPSNLYFETAFPRIDADCLSRLRRWADQTDEARLIVIDVFHKIRSATGAQGGYGRDYADLSALQTLAREKDIGIMLVHHLRKTGGDPFDRMMGSIGIQGAADTLIVLDDRGLGARLLARGRDIEESAQELRFDELAMRWRPSHRPAVVKNPERARIMAILRDSSKPMSPLQISLASGQTANAVSKLLGAMVAEGMVSKAGWGHLRLLSTISRRCSRSIRSERPEWARRSERSE